MLINRLAFHILLPVSEEKSHKHQNVIYCHITWTKPILFFSFSFIFIIFSTDLYIVIRVINYTKYEKERTTIERSALKNPLAHIGRAIAIRIQNPDAPKCRR